MVLSDRGPRPDHGNSSSVSLFDGVRPGDGAEDECLLKGLRILEDQRLLSFDMIQFLNSTTFRDEKSYYSKMAADSMDDWCGVSKDDQLRYTDIDGRALYLPSSCPFEVVGLTLSMNE